MTRNHPLPRPDAAEPAAPRNRPSVDLRKSGTISHPSAKAIQRPLPERAESIVRNGGLIRDEVWALVKAEDEGGQASR